MQKAATLEATFSRLLHISMTGTPDAHSPIALFNTPVLTEFGRYHMRPLDIGEARELVSRLGFVSAIGHEAAAQVMSELLAIDCPARRVTYRQRPGEQGIVLRLSTRLAEGQILKSADAMHRHGYSLALLVRER